MDCKEFRKNVSIYLDGQLTASQRADFEKHVSECGECAKILEQTRLAVKIVSQMPKKPLPVGFFQRLNDRLDNETAKKPSQEQGFNWHRFMRGAAVSLAVIMAMVLVKDMFKQGYEPKPLRMSQDQAISCARTEEAEQKTGPQSPAEQPGKGGYELKGKAEFAMPIVNEKSQKESRGKHLDEQKSAPISGRGQILPEQKKSVLEPSATASKEPAGAPAASDFEPPVVKCSPMPASEKSVSMKTSGQEPCASPAQGQAYAIKQEVQLETPSKEQPAAEAPYAQPKKLEQVSPRKMDMAARQYAPKPEMKMAAKPMMVAKDQFTEKRNVAAEKVQLSNDWQGYYSGYTTPMTKVITDEISWGNFWHVHTKNQESTAPRVDFGMEMVVAVFMGERQTSGYSIEIVNVEKQADKIIIEYKETSPTSGAPASQVLTQPYHIKVIEKSSLPVIFKKID
jgi:hypothetical protein